MDRAEQNRALRDLDKLVEDIGAFGASARSVILRNRFSSGQKHHKRGELAEMEGTPGPHHNDPTGEDAVWAEKADSVGKTITAMSDALSKWGVMAQWVLDLSSTDVAERAKRTVPDCLACGKPVEGRVISGYDRSCYDKWVYQGRPDRMRFEKEQKELEEVPTVE